MPVSRGGTIPTPHCLKARNPPLTHLPVRPPPAHLPPTDSNTPTPPLPPTPPNPPNTNPLPPKQLCRLPEELLVSIMHFCASDPITLLTLRRSSRLFLRLFGSPAFRPLWTCPPPPLGMKLTPNIWPSPRVGLLSPSQTAALRALLAGDAASSRHLCSDCQSLRLRSDWPARREAVTSPPLLRRLLPRVASDLVLLPSAAAGVAFRARVHRPRGPRATVPTRDAVVDDDGGAGAAGAGPAAARVRLGGAQPAGDGGRVPAPEPPAGAAAQDDDAVSELAVPVPERVAGSHQEVPGHRAVPAGRPAPALRRAHAHAASRRRRGAVHPRCCRPTAVASPPGRRTVHRSAGNPRRAARDAGTWGQLMHLLEASWN